MGEDREKFPKERRRGHRVSGALVDYYFEGQGASAAKNAFIKDVCIYGIGIYTSEAVEIGKKIGLNIFLFGDDLPIKAIGRVVWQKRGDYLGYFNVGIEFIEMSDKHQKILADHIAANDKGDQSAS